MRMVDIQKYLTLSNEARLKAETTTDPTMKDHFMLMAEHWKNLADYTLRTETPRL